MKRLLLVPVLALAFSACGGGDGAAPTPTGGPADTTPPSTPSGLMATTDGPFGVSLSWQPSTDSVGVMGYGMERCQGAGCSTFTQIATPTGTNFTDIGLAAATSYSYRVRAADAAANLSAYSNVASATTAAAPPPPPAVLPAWVNALSPGQWHQIPNTSMQSIDPSPLPPGNTGPQSKVVAWTSFVVDTRTSMVYSVANGGHSDYGGNEVDRLELENDPPRWVARLAPTPNNQIVEEVTHYSDGRPTSRHTFYGVTFNEFNDRIMLVGGARFGFAQGFGIFTTDSYNITANTYSPAFTHPNISPSAVQQFIGSAVVGNPLTGDIYSFGDFASAKWTRATNTWAATGASGSPPYGVGAMSAFDTFRGRILMLGGSNSDRHTYTLSSNTFAQITLTGANAVNVSGAEQGAMVYVAAIDRYLIRLGGPSGTVYQVHPTTFEVTTFATGGASVPSTQNGPYNKFLYVPRLRGCVYVPVYSQNVWFLRVH